MWAYHYRQREETDEIVETKRTIGTSNPGCAAPGDGRYSDRSPGGTRVFADPVVAGAIIDRLLHRATVINIKGKSYRMRAYHEQERQEGGAIVR